VLYSFDTGVKVIEAVANFLPVLGLPFLFISWIMLINMAYSMSDVPVKSVWRYINIGLLLLLFVGGYVVYTFSKSSGNFIDTHLKYVEVGSLIGLDLIYYIAFILIINSKTRKMDISGRNYAWRFSLLIFLTFLLRSAALPFTFINVWILAVVILVYFGSNFIPLFYLRVYSDKIFKPVMAENASEDVMKFIFKKYKITKREREIVIQICHGKTNQQIADELFISLQTVKDHTHRIYSKIGINSRMQLVQKVNR
jgi:DNA-binding CsgD family transcriptional regulator